MKIEMCENTAFTVTAILVCVVILGIIGGCSYNSKLDHDQAIAAYRSGLEDVPNTGATSHFGKK